MRLLRLYRNLQFLVWAGVVPMLSVAQDFTRYVNPFIGTGGHGHTFPGACVPNGMVQLSPDTDTEGWDWVSGYRHTDTTLMGFSHTHLSGTGCGDLGDLLVIPRTGRIQTSTGSKAQPFPGARSRIRFQTQQASPGYYSVLLDDFGIRAELTASAHCGYHRYTFPRSDSAHIMIFPGVGIPLDADNTGWAHLKVVNDTTIEGYRTSFSWVPDQRVYFVMRFSRPFDTCQLSSWGSPSWGNRETRGWWRKGKDVYGSVHFKTREGEAIEMKVAISAVSIRNAYENLAAEIPGWGFEQVHNRAKEQWNEILSKVEIEGTKEQKEIFYTGLYHAYIQPNNMADVNGEYAGPDTRIARSPFGRYYSTLSLWDTYRAANPLYTLLTPGLVTELVQSMILHYENQGLLPIWTLWGQETQCMIGNHAIPVIADAYFKGLIPDDWKERAFEAVYGTSVNSSRDSDWELYERYGYFPFDIIRGESVSKTLEVAFDDWCVAQMASAMGKADIHQKFMKRSGYVDNLFDHSIDFFRPKNTRGEWMPNFNPRNITHGHGFTEANAWQYLWHVQQDVPGLIALLGGPQKFEQKLDSLFTISSDVEGHQGDVTGFIGQYVHGNEPSHHVAYLYNYVGKPDKTRRMLNMICDSMYSNRPDGYAGNEDCGQMSAWYIFTALGFYPVNPASGRYDLGFPQVQAARLRLPNGNMLHIQQSKGTKKQLGQSGVWLNGQPLKSLFIEHAQLMAGGELVFYYEIP